MPTFDEVMHGINHQRRSADEIRQTWVQAFCASLDPAAQTLLKNAEILVPYYGDALFDALEARMPKGEGPVPLSACEVHDDEAAFYIEMLKEAAAAARLSEAERQCQRRFETDPG